MSGNTLSNSGPGAPGINGFELQFDNVNAAIGDGEFYRQKLDIKEEDDDVAAMKSGSQPKEWVRKFMQAFSHGYIEAQEDVTRSQAQTEYFLRWQELAQKVVEKAREMTDVDHLERCCWYLFDAVIKTHELGASKVGNQFASSKLKCSARLSAIVSIIEKFALVRKEILHLAAINQISADPEGFMHRKQYYLDSNANRAISKKVKEAEAKDENKEDEGAVGAADAADAVPEHSQRASRAKSRRKAKQMPSSAKGNVASQAPGDSEAAVVDGTSNKGKGKGKVRSSTKDKDLSSTEDNEPLPSQTPGENEVPVVESTSNKGKGKGKVSSSVKAKMPAQSQTPGGSEVTAVDGINNKTKGNRKAKRAHSVTPEVDGSDNAVKKDDMPNKRVARGKSSVAAGKTSIATGVKARGGRKAATGGPKTKK